jgi:hypothetical protein
MPSRLAMLDKAGELVGQLADKGGVLQSWA